jgi:hypothetical protein
MTPLALQRAALEENGGPDPGAIVYSIFFDVKHISLRCPFGRIPSGFSRDWFNVNIIFSKVYHNRL